MSDETMLIFFNSLSLNNHTQILQTELHRVPLEFNKRPELVPFGGHCINSHYQSFVLMLFEENKFTMVFKALKAENTCTAVYPGTQSQNSRKIPYLS